MRLAPSVQSTLDRFAGKVRARFGDRVREVVLFGSRARGEAREHSDTDVLVVIEGLTHEERRNVWDLAGDTRMEGPVEDDVGLAPLAVSCEEIDRLRAGERRIALDIARDGIPL